MTTPPNVDIGLADFADPSLLLIADQTAFRQLADAFKAGREFQIGQEPTGARRAILQVVPVDGDGELLRQGNRFIWRISPSESAQVARQLSVLADTDQPAHAYIDPTSNATAIQILASKGEYESAELFE